MADDGGAEADDDFSLDELTGWSDCDCTMGAYPTSSGASSAQVPVKQPVKRPRAKSGSLRKSAPKTASGGSTVPSVLDDTPSIISDVRRLSGSMWHGDLSKSSVLLDEDVLSVPTSKQVNSSASAGALMAPVMAPVMILPVQEKSSPLAKPFTIYTYTNLQVHKPPQVQQHPYVQFHVVTSAPPEDCSSDPRDDHLPPLISLRDALGAPSAKPAYWGMEESTSAQVVASEPRRQSVLRVQPAASIKMQWTITIPSQTPSAKATVNKKQLVKNDKPTVRSHIALARAQDASSRRYSDGAKRSHGTQRVALDSGYLSSALYAPRRQSLNNAVD